MVKKGFVFQCKNCKYVQSASDAFKSMIAIQKKTNIGRGGKLLGGLGLAGFGYWGWVSFFFAGTGMAMPIALAFIFGGVAFAVLDSETINRYKNKFIGVFNDTYKCPQCGKKTWQHYEEPVNLEDKR